MSTKQARKCATETVAVEEPTLDISALIEHRVEIIDRHFPDAEKNAQTIELFGAWLDVNISKPIVQKSDIIAAWDEARDPGCHGGKYIPRRK